MGAWGLGSDENDWTFDAAGLGIFERMTALIHPLSLTKADEWVDELVSKYGKDFPAGLVIFFLKLGLGLPKATLEHALETLKAELTGGEATTYSDKTSRYEVIEQEIEMISDALKNDPHFWTTDKFIVGVRGITSGGTCGSSDSSGRGVPAGQQPQLARRNNDGKLEAVPQE
jgi:hypothetical protein